MVEEGKGSREDVNARHLEEEKAAQSYYSHVVRVLGMRRRLGNILNLYQAPLTYFIP